VSELANDRNNAIHAPTEFVIDGDYYGMKPPLLTMHRRAKNLQGKQILDEFAWCELWAIRLTLFAQQCTGAIAYENASQWPERPHKTPKAPKRK
jgi:hypothetical protein